MLSSSEGPKGPSGETMDLYVPRIIKDNYQGSFSYMATNLWNQLPTDVK